MAWWEEEKKKPKRNRSDRYKVAFPDEYTPEEVKDAQDRLDRKTTRSIETFYLYDIYDGKPKEH